MRRRTKILLGLGIFFLILLLAVGTFAFLLLHRAGGEYFESAGARIFYSVEGAGPPVILVHGVGANLDLNWRRPGVIRALAKDFQVISFDLRGHGLSDTPSEPEQYGIQMVEDITRLMDHLGIAKAHLAGYSLGGFIALKAASVHPERFLSVAVCAAGWKNPDDPSPIPSPYRPPEPPTTEQVTHASVFAFAEGKPLFHRIRSGIGDYLMNPVAKKAIKKSYMDLAVYRPSLESNSVPMLSVIGTGDGFLYLARDLAAVTRNLEAREIPGANHFALPFSRTFKKTLHDFLQRHNGTAGS